MVLRSIVGALVLLLPLVASAQGTPGQHPSVLEMRRDRESAARRPIGHPAPPVDEAVRDAERATGEYERAPRAEELLREQKAAAANRRPDLNYDVTSGIQQRNLLNLR
jgi:hypothetical protein